MTQHAVPERQLPRISGAKSKLHQPNIGTVTTSLSRTASSCMFIIKKWNDLGLKSTQWRQIKAHSIWGKQAPSSGGAKRDRA